MPVVPYYQGRRACTWTKDRSGPVRADAPGPPAVASPATRQPVMTPGQRRAPAGNIARGAACAGAWQAWAANWFTPGRELELMVPLDARELVGTGPPSVLK